MEKQLFDIKLSSIRRKSNQSSSAPQGHFNSIIPPHMLDEISKNGTPEQRKMADHALKLSEQYREVRKAKLGTRVESAFPGRLPRLPHKNRNIYDTVTTTNLPGTLVRSEGQPPTNDVAVNEAYDGLGATFDLYWDIFNRNSIDNLGMDLIGTVHYGKKYNNAFWNGTQMVFGDGDGVIFNRFTISVDVIGHELTHGVTQHTAGLIYSNQSGALNESISDVFGSMVKQYCHVPKQTSAQADWIIGAGLFTPQIKGVGIRSLKAPGTAYNDPLLGKDPQPEHMNNYDHRTGDNGGVHINSGIPNHAFYLLAIALGGYSWEKAGRIWYATLLDHRLLPTAQFQDFANLTAENARLLFGDPVRNAVVNAWQQVGIIITPVTVPLYRYWNGPAADHFYTTNWSELGSGNYGWVYEGIQCYVYPSHAPSSVPLYRYWNGPAADHFYTTNWGELGSGKNGWVYEGIQCYVLATQLPGTVPLYRYWNGPAADHFYTTNWGELGSGKYGWVYEGIQCYVHNQPTSSLTMDEINDLNMNLKSIDESAEKVDIPLSFQVAESEKATGNAIPATFQHNGGNMTNGATIPSTFTRVSASGIKEPEVHSMTDTSGSKIEKSENGTIITIRLEK
jgi:Zn-dependent metalloprotease